MPDEKDKTNKNKNRAKALPRRTNVTESSTESSDQIDSEKSTVKSQFSHADVHAATLMAIANSANQAKKDARMSKDPKEKKEKLELMNSNLKLLEEYGKETKSNLSKLGFKKKVESTKPSKIGVRRSKRVIKQLQLEDSWRNPKKLKYNKNSASQNKEEQEFVDDSNIVVSSKKIKEKNPTIKIGE